jgi:hypothetical protein
MQGKPRSLSMAQDIAFRCWIPGIVSSHARSPSVFHGFSGKMPLTRYPMLKKHQRKRHRKC